MLSDNPLLKRYGTIACAFFADQNNQNTSTPSESIRVITTTIKAGLGNAHAEMSVLDYGDSGTHKRLAAEVNVLAAELTANPNGELADQLKDFQHNVKTENEAQCDNNPFYQLSKQIFQCTTAAALAYLIFMQSNLLARAPKPLTNVTWGKTFFTLLTFVVSAFTTAYGVNQLLQLHGFNDWLDGSKWEFWRWLIAAGCGISLSFVILDFKRMLARAIIEMGSVLKGLGRACWARPLWMAIAIGLTCLSIKTNYDGGVTIISKLGDLTQQSQEIEARVKLALGTADPNVTPPANSLHAALLDLIANKDKALDEFQWILSDEETGKASSAIATQGPRYWGKYMVVHGGFDNGVDIAKLAHNSPLSMAIDLILQTANLDLSSGIAAKLNRTTTDFTTYLKTVEHEVTEQLVALRALMQINAYSPAELSRIMLLEHYHINAIVKHIAARLESVEQRYIQTITTLNNTIAAHINVLTKIDRTGRTSNTDYAITIAFAMPDSSAISALSNGVPRAQQKTFKALQDYLATAYGLEIAAVILGFILTLSVLMDLADPILYSRAIARQGRSERLMAQPYIANFRKWEAEFIDNCQQFFQLDEVKAIYAGMLPNNENNIVFSIFLLFDELDKRMTNPSRYHHRPTIRFRFLEAAGNPHITTIAYYNIFASAILRLVKHKNKYLAAYIKRVIPGIVQNQNISDIRFVELHGKNMDAANLAENKLTFEIRKAYASKKFLLKILRRLIGKKKGILEDIVNINSQCHSINREVGKVKGAWLKTQPLTGQVLGEKKAILETKRERLELILQQYNERIDELKQLADIPKNEHGNDLLNKTEDEDADTDKDRDTGDNKTATYDNCQAISCRHDWIKSVAENEVFYSLQQLDGKRKKNVENDNIKQPPPKIGKTAQPAELVAQLKSSATVAKPDKIEKTASIKKTESNATTAQLKPEKNDSKPEIINQSAIKTSNDPLKEFTDAKKVIAFRILRQAGKASQRVEKIVCEELVNQLTGIPMRKSARIAFNTACELALDGRSPIAMQSIEINADGMGLTIMAPLPPDIVGLPGSITFTTDITGKTLELTIACEVLRIAREQIGIRFLNIDTQTNSKLKAINDHLFAQAAPH